MRIQSHNKPLDILRKRRGTSRNLLLNVAKNQKTLDIVQNSIPPKLFHTCAAATIIDDLLTIVTTSQAAAGKIRYYTQEILKSCRKAPQMGRINHIKIKVAQPLTAPAVKQRKIKGISHGSAQCIAATAKQIDDVSLKASLERLARHADKQAK